MFKILSKREGFSLVEIMIVVAIIVMIAAGAANVLSQSSNKAKYARAEKDLDSVYTAFINVFNTEDGGFGADISGDKILSGLPAAVQDNLDKFLTRETANLLDPWGNEYKVIITTNWSEGNEEGHFKVACMEDDGSTVRTNKYMRGDPEMSRVIINTD